MKVKFIETTNEFNWGKFLVGRFDSEWSYRSLVDHYPLLSARGWGLNHLLVVDLQTGEGFVAYPGGLAKADLRKRKIWVCPMFEAFLTWLYQQDLTDLDTLPASVELKSETALYGYRRSGLAFDEAFSVKLRKFLEAYDILNFEQLCALPEKVVLGLLGHRKTMIRELHSVFEKHGYRFTARKPTTD